ncbi:hypothetical protein [Salinarimonas sp.]|uniref:hypothetical protein n=1 Tax=Salinarimonas sp. TaxID=2766526 RepID=UPI0032D8E118
MNMQLHDSLRPGSWGQVFNLFRRRGSDLVCAVPLDRAIPPFVDDEWEYLCEADAASSLPGFDYGSVAGRARRHGFSFFRTGPRAA